MKPPEPQPAGCLQVEAVWISDQPDLQGVDWCRLASRRSGWRLAGRLAAIHDGHPLDMSYEIEVDGGWRTSRAATQVHYRSETNRRRLRRDRDGSWHIDGLPAPELHGCVDVDLSLTPATNTPPIRRLAATAWNAKTLQVAWINVPTLNVGKVSQHYRRLSPGTWRYTAGRYTADLTVDEHGLLLRYGDNLWMRHPQDGSV